MTDTKLIQFLETDYMMVDLANSIKEEGIERREIIVILRFLGTFAISLRRMGLEDMSDVFGDRVNAFAFLIHKLGYTHAKRLKGVTTSGIDTLISQAYYNLGNDQ